MRFWQLHLKQQGPVPGKVLKSSVFSPTCSLCPFSLLPIIPKSSAFFPSSHFPSLCLVFPIQTAQVLPSLPEKPSQETNKAGRSPLFLTILHLLEVCCIKLLLGVGEVTFF